MAKVFPPSIGPRYFRPPFASVPLNTGELRGVGFSVLNRIAARTRARARARARARTRGPGGRNDVLRQPVPLRQRPGAYTRPLSSST